MMRVAGVVDEEIVGEVIGIEVGIYADNDWFDAVTPEFLKLDTSFVGLSTVVYSTIVM